MTVDHREVASHIDLVSGRHDRPDRSVCIWIPCRQQARHLVDGGQPPPDLPSDCGKQSPDLEAPPVIKKRPDRIVCRQMPTRRETGGLIDGSQVLARLPSYLLKAPADVYEAV